MWTADTLGFRCNIGTIRLILDVPTLVLNGFEVEYLFRGIA